MSATTRKKPRADSTAVKKLAEYAAGLEKFPTFKSDRAAEAFVEKGDLSKYNLKGRRMSEVFPELASQMKRRGRPKLDQPKQVVTMRLDRDLLEHLRAKGAGWQTRVNAILRQVIFSEK